jgi:hypothetical protein
VITRHIAGGIAENPLENAPLSIAEFHAAFQPGGLITNAIAGAFAPDGVGTNANAVGTRAAKLYFINRNMRQVNSTIGAVVVLPFVESPGPNQGTFPTMVELGFPLGAHPTRAQIHNLNAARINIIHDIYGEDSFRPGLLAPERKDALERFFS